MAKPRMDLSVFVDKLLDEHDGDVLREGVRVLAQALMETEVTTLVGADRHARSASAACVSGWGQMATRSGRAAAERVDLE